MTINMSYYKDVWRGMRPQLAVSGDNQKYTDGKHVIDDAVILGLQWLDALNEYTHLEFDDGEIVPLKAFFA